MASQTNHRVRVSPYVLATALIALAAASPSTWPGPANALQPLNNVVIDSVESTNGTDFSVEHAKDADIQVRLSELSDGPNQHWNFQPSGEDPYYFIMGDGLDLAELNCNNDFCQVDLVSPITCGPDGCVTSAVSPSRASKADGSPPS